LPSRSSRQHRPTDPASHADAGELAAYEVLVCVCGGIAAYKVAALVSELVRQGCGVTVAMTRSARRLVGPATFRALTGRPVYTSMWRSGGAARMPHLGLAEAADLIVVAPATANILGKLAGGIADDLVSTLLLAADSPVVLVPAMNTRMWQHPAVRRNVAWLREAGFILVGPEEGRLACGTVGPGRMVDPQRLLEAIQTHLRSRPAKRLHSPTRGSR